MLDIRRLLLIAGFRARSRLRLREEVDVLRALTAKYAEAAAQPGARHPNVLAYVDSWEQDEALFIQTELCELGNFGTFLWEYGRAFPQLDEARVWKIVAELSNVRESSKLIG
jgi:mitosis inhibitor protein kinase SWE1